MTTTIVSGLHYLSNPLLEDGNVRRVVGDLERQATGQELRTYTVLTTDPNELMEPIHNRTPVILTRKER